MTNHAKPLNYQDATAGAIHALRGPVTLRAVVIGLDYETALLKLWQGEVHNREWGDRCAFPFWAVYVMRLPKVYP